jgi:hypothetical protein
MTSLIRFPGCPGLPKGMRETLYLEYVTEILAQPIQDRPIEPPITKASQSMRKEILPLFYELYPLRLQTLIFGGSHGLDYRRPV